LISLYCYYFYINLLKELDFLINVFSINTT